MLNATADAGALHAGRLGVSREPRGMLANPRPQTLLTNSVQVPAETRTYLVCGVQRGGTSMVSAVMRALGVDMGMGGLNHEDPRILNKAHDLPAFLAERNAAAPIWGFKMPHVALDLDHFARLTRHPVLVLVFRNPVSILDSIIVRGDSDLVEGLTRINSYFHAMLDFAVGSPHPVVMVSYERACSSPYQFVDEIVPALGLMSSAGQRQDAIACITGDGGGYTHLPKQWHHIEVSPRAAQRRGAPVPGFRSRLDNIDLVAVFDAAERRDVRFVVDFESSAPDQRRWVQMAVDFGDGFNMLNAYNLYFPRGSAIRLRHEGRVRRVAFGTRSGDPKIMGVSSDVTG